MADTDPVETLADMRVDIGVIAEGMKGLTKMFEGFMCRTENCLSDHEGRLRAAEVNSSALTQITDINRRLGVVEKVAVPKSRVALLEVRVDAIENEHLTEAGGWKMIAKISAITGGVVGLLCGLIGAAVAFFSMMGGA